MASLRLARGFAVAAFTAVAATACSSSALAPPEGGADHPASEDHSAAEFTNGDHPTEASLDASVADTSDAVAEAAPDANACSGSARISCSRVTLMCGAFVVCDDVPLPPVCGGGTWRCPSLAVEESQCGYSGAIPPGCECTANGVRCSDGGSDTRSDASDAATDAGVRIDASDASSDVSCALACVPSKNSIFCNTNEVQWDCFSPSLDRTSFNASCGMAGTNLVRYCCPPTFLPLCH